MSSLLPNEVRTWTGLPGCDHLRRVDLFSELSDDDLRTMAGRSVTRRVRAGGLIVGQGEPAEGFYVVAAGRAKVVLFGETGRELTLRVLGPGDFFGEEVVLEHGTVPTSLVAIEQTLLVVIDRAAFIAALERCPRAALRLVRHMAERTRRSDALIGGLALHDVGARLVRALIDLGEAQGEPRDDGVFIRRRPTQQDLANMVGTSRESVSRALSAMARRGLVVARGRSLLLRRALMEAQSAAA
ncbi:MAG: Crp/Fnr family transcriptional regulator [Proteobacteria bacterium]|nr:Crp/Fnr family transcriptional regulator [Pseudomonadota bacterium]